jgi:ABC-type spermidine/putrescine transport system permease subunit II
MKINNRTLLESATVATVYTSSFYLAKLLIFNALLAKYPSQSDDDVRADIGIPTILIAYVVALLFSYIAIFIIYKLKHKSFSLKSFILFCLLIPFVYQLPILGLGLLALISSTYNYSSYFVYEISLAISIWSTICIVYWLSFKYRSRH